MSIKIISRIENGNSNNNNLKNNFDMNMVIKSIFLSDHCISNNCYYNKVSYIKKFEDFVLEVETYKYKNYLFILKVIKNAQLI